jgi:O-antigen/teichoic acid export membrane protein
MVKSIMDEYQTGLFAAASRISLLFTLFALSVGTVLNTRVARYNRADLINFYHKTIPAVIGLVILTPILVLLAKPLLLLSAGTAYLPALPAVQLLLISSTITMATVLFIAPFYTLNYPQYFMYTGLLQIAALVIGNLMLMPLLGITGSAWAKIGMRTLVLFYTLIATKIALKVTHETH